MLDAMEVTKYVLYRQSMSNLKLQKILYLCQAWSLVILREPLFQDDIQAWDFGPVVEPVYRHYLPYQLGNIPSPKAHPYFEEKYEAVIDAVVEHFKDWNVTSLTKLTQNQDPWVKARKRRRGNGTIPNRAIQKYFDKP